MSKECLKEESKISLARELECLIDNAKVPDRSYDLELAKMEFDGFKKLFEKYVEQGKRTSIDWDSIEKPPAESIVSYDSLDVPMEKENIKNMLQQLVVVKLNGGLGTSMGCKGPKSVISVRSDKTFLDLTVEQIEYMNKLYDTDVPLVLMNSFNTDDDTQKVIRKYRGYGVRIITFNQSRYPRINKETLLPSTKDLNSKSDSEAWYPPGHGDFYASFYNSGKLESLLKEGRKYCFISNIDNMGATVDLGILNMCLNKQNEFIMEVTDKTRADVKGGTLICYDGKLRLLEAAQVPKGHEEDFKSVKKFQVFNTNNLWINLAAIKRIFEANGFDMEIIVNPKVLDNGLNVIQLETAVGAAMKSFENARGIKVPRSRFLPVKKCSDLLLVMSNLYTLKCGHLEMSSDRMFQTTPLVKLGDTNFKKVKDFMRSFKSIPDILELDHLTVSGNVNFGRDVSLRGTVIIIANHGEQIDIPDGSILENKIVSGNLRVLDH